jgi:DNA-binding beta-propeller fold protein YncE
LLAAVVLTCSFATAGGARFITPSADPARFGGSGDGGFRDGPGSVARYYHPQGLAVSPDGRELYVADSWQGLHIAPSPFQLNSSSYLYRPLPTIVYRLQGAAAEVAANATVSVTPRPPSSLKFKKEFGYHISSTIILPVS